MDISYYKKFEPIDGKWYITRELGRGAFGTVFEVERRDFGEDMKSAMKVVSVPSSPNDVSSYREENFDLDDKSVTSYFYGFVEEFVKEFQLMHKLRGHSNIVSYEDHTVKKREGEVGWDIFIRMELLTPMGKYFAGRNISAEDTIRLGIDICKALEVCQKHQIIHRDIKPSNIFVSNTGDFKLGDFGVARTLEKTSSGLSKKGTYTYMAPEVFKGEEYGASVDIYSLGIVMYRLLNNNMEPFREDRGHSGEESALTRRMRGDEMPKPANADGRLAEIILKACNFNPDERFESANEMRQELEKELINVQRNTLEEVVFEEEEEKFAEVEPDEKTEVTVGLFGDVDADEADEKTVSLYGEDSESTEKDNLFEQPIEDEKTVGIFSENGSADDEISSENDNPQNAFKHKTTTFLVAAILIIIVCWFGVGSLRNKLINLVPESVEMEENMEIEFLTEVYSAGFWDGNINRKVSLDTSLVKDICGVEDHGDGMTLTALKAGTAQIGVSINGSAFRQVDVTVYEKIDKNEILQKFIDAENLLKTVKEDSTINQNNVTYEKQALENIIKSYGGIREKINESSSLELVECKTIYQTKVLPAVEGLTKAYEIAKKIEADKKKSITNKYYKKSKDNTGNNTTQPKDKCSVCDSTDHTTHPKPKCPTCDSTSHTKHPDDLYIEPF